MPRLYEYVGIYILFHSAEHRPVHVHAKYNDCEVKVSFYTKDGKIVRTTYTKIKGMKDFPPSKLKQLKNLINMEKYNILATWNDFFILNKKVKTRVITKNDLK